MVGDEPIGTAGDYDIVVVVNAFVLPIAFPILKKAESDLSTALGTHVTVNPLLKYRAHHARGNLFLYKLKEEGLVLYGDDYKEIIETGPLCNMPPERFFSYFFSMTKKLLEKPWPDLVINGRLEDPETSRRLLLHLTKALLQLGDLYLLLHSRHAQTPDALVDRLAECADLEDDMGRGFRSTLTRLVALSRQGMAEEEIDAQALWFKVQDYVLQMFHTLCTHSWPAPLTPPNQGEEFLGSPRLNDYVVNLQYVALTLLLKRRLAVRALVSNPPITDRIWISLLWLLKATARGSVREEYVRKARDLIDGFLPGIPKKCGYGSQEWSRLRDAINARWSCACTVMVF